MVEPREESLQEEAGKLNMSEEEEPHQRRDERLFLGWRSDR
jgi:hypothetical protein